MKCFFALIRAICDIRGSLPVALNNDALFLISPRVLSRILTILKNSRLAKKARR